jgi:hypothetical protein
MEILAAMAGGLLALGAIILVASLLHYGAWKSRERRAIQSRLDRLLGPRH